MVLGSINGVNGATASVNVGIGTTTPDASAVLDLTSTERGMLVPRMTSAQRSAISSPATGLLVYDTDVNSFWFYNGTAWTNISAGGGGGGGGAGWARRLVRRSEEHTSELQSLMRISYAVFCLKKK